MSELLIEDEPLEKKTENVELDDKKKEAENTTQYDNADKSCS